MKKLLFIILALNCSASFANLVGKWSGSGKASMDYGRQSRLQFCNKVELEVVEEEKSLNFKPFSILCETAGGTKIDMDYGLSFNRDGSELYYYNLYVGSYDRDSLFLEVPKLGEEDLFTVSMKVVEGKLYVEMQEAYYRQKIEIRYAFELK